MTPKITIHADCGDAPKKQLLRDLNIAFANADVEAIMAVLADDIHWRIIGEVELHGKAEVRAALEAMQDVVTRELVIHAIITQGGAGAINGEIITEDGQRVAFCDICQFSGAAGNRINAMTSYTIDITGGRN